MGSLTGQGQQAYGDLLQQYTPEQYQEFYQKSFIDPAQQALQRQIIPGLKESFMGLDESASGALNRALAQSATDVSTGLGSGILNQYNQHQANRMGALGGLQGLAGQRTFEPLVNQEQGILGSLIQGAATLGGGFAMSSSDYKENIRPYKIGLEALKNMQTYQYDYKPEYSSAKDQIGVMVEESPQEIVEDHNGRKGINIYSLCGFLVNCINELNAKVEKLEAR